MRCRKSCTSRLTVSAFSCITADVWLTDCAVASVARTEVVTSPMARVICWVSRAVTSVLRLISLVAAFCCSMAAAEGRFQIYPIETIDEGIALLTGRPAGTREPDGSFPEGSIYRLVEERLVPFAEARRHFGDPRK